MAPCGRQGILLQETCCLNVRHDHLTAEQLHERGWDAWLLLLLRLLQMPGRCHLLLLRIPSRRCPLLLRIPPVGAHHRNEVLF